MMTRPCSILLLVLLICCNSLLKACTIFSGVDKNGHSWAGNNEDNIFNFNTYFHIVIPTDTSFGYIYFTNTNRSYEFMQGGANEAGLFYDANAVASSKYKDLNKKKDFPGTENNALLTYILKKCKTVQEVLTLLETYRLPGLESGQLHFADKYGNHGIIVADSMWITNTNYQISTNYNLCHANKDGQTCWRYPIAERILNSKDPCFESFTQICDSTSQHIISSTVYSNIHDLSTGDIWLYYGSDFKHPYKTTIQELFRKGNTAFFLYNLFPNNSLVVCYETYKAKGIESSLNKLTADTVSPAIKEAIARLLYYDLIVYEHAFHTRTAFSPLLASARKSDDFIQLMDAFALFCSNKKQEAIDNIHAYQKAYSKGYLSSFADGLLNQIEGNFNKDANVEFELEGYEYANYVLVEGLDFPNYQYFLIKKGKKWVGKFKLNPDEYGYTFLIDGRTLLDPRNKETLQVDDIIYSKLVVKK